MQPLFARSCPSFLAFVVPCLRNTAARTVRQTAQNICVFADIH